MAVTAQVTHVPMDVYLSTSYEPGAEYVDGLIEERPMGLEPRRLAGGNP
jgi:hypothetical protein